MDCEECTDDGRDCVKSWREASSARINEHELGNIGAIELRLDIAATVPCTASRREMHLSTVPFVRQNRTHTSNHAPTEIPFMNNMDEITYWIYTKRAPCLLNYDNVLKTQSEVAHCSKAKPKSAHSVVQEVPSSKKKKRKLLMPDDDSVSTEKQQNLYFDGPHKQNRKTIISSCKSETLVSDIDFNIRNSSIQTKPKKSKLQKNCGTTLHKKNKIVTSTPRVISLRRSLRQAQQTTNNSNLNSSFVFNSSVVNENSLKHDSDQRCGDKLTKSSEFLAGGDQNGGSKKNYITNMKSKNNVLNRQFEDVSDVSGFTANYIRSTKVQSNKRPRKLRCKSTRKLMKESQHSLPKDSAMIVCVNKTLNTDLEKDTALNCSTDSSQNIVNFITLKNNDKSSIVNKSTPLLKFMDTRTKSKESLSNKQNRITNLNISIQSSTSRYPKRHKLKDFPVVNNGSQNNRNRRRINKNPSDFNNSDKKENPDEKPISRTRSGRNIGLTIHPLENSVFVLSNSTEQVSSMISMNVASRNAAESKLKKKRKTNRTVRTRRSGQSLSRDSLRDRSGFAACFSESDDDSEPLRKKFFCP